MRSLFLAAISAASLSSPMHADDGRYEAARRHSLEMSINAKAFAGQEAETLCFAASADIAAIKCLILNEYDESSGEVLFFLERMDPAKGADLVNECRKGALPSGTIRPSCRLYIKTTVDSSGFLYALDYEQAEVRE